jgi:trehalose-6-phosphatase
VNDLNQIAKSVEELLDDSLYSEFEIEEKDDGVVIHLHDIEDEHREIDTALQHIKQIAVVEVYPLWNDSKCEVKLEDRGVWERADELLDQTPGAEETREMIERNKDDE